MNWEIPHVQVGFRKGRGTRDQTANIRWIIEKAKVFQKSIYFFFIDYTNYFDLKVCGLQQTRKFWKSWEYQTTWPASWEICPQVKKQQLELVMKEQTGSKLGKEYIKAVYCHPAYLIYMQSTSCEMPGWMKHKLESRLPGEISIILDMQMTPPLWQKVKRNQWASWWEGKRRVEKVGLKLNIQETKIMAYIPITSWQIERETEKDFIFLCSKITADADYGHEIKRRLLLGRKTMDNLNSILKSKDITLPTKVHLVKAMVFPVVM